MKRLLMSLTIIALMIVATAGSALAAGKPGKAPNVHAEEACNHGAAGAPWCGLVK